MGNKFLSFFQKISIIVFCFMVSTLHAKTMDLQQAINYAIENNVQLKSALLDKTVRLHELKILRQKFSPQLSLNMSATVQQEDYFNENFNEKKLHSYPSLRMLTPVGTQIEIFTEQNYGYEQNARKSGSAVHVVIEQPLLQGRNRVVNTWSIENARVLAEIEELLLSQAKNQVIYNVILSYHHLELVEQNVKSQERWLAQAKRFYDNLKTKVEAGRAPQSDLSSSLFQVNQAQSYLTQAQFEYHQAMRKFKETIGWEGDDNIIIVHSEPFKDNAIDKDNFLDIVVKNDIETKVLNLNKQRMQSQMIIAKDQKLIDLRLRGDWTAGRYHVYGNNTATEDIFDDNIYNAPFIHNSGNYSAHLLLSIPLTGKDQRHHQTLATKVEQEKLEYESWQHQKQLVFFVEGLFEQKILQKQQAELSHQQLILAQKNYDDALMKLEMGRTSMFEVLSLREKLHDAQMQENATKIAYLDILANMDFSAGLLTATWLS